jgi:hypothetical protein
MGLWEVKLGSERIAAYAETEPKVFRFGSQAPPGRKSSRRCLLACAKGPRRCLETTKNSRLAGSRLLLPEWDMKLESEGSQIVQVGEPTSILSKRCNATEHSVASQKVDWLLSEIKMNAGSCCR